MRENEGVLLAATASSEFIKPLVKVLAWGTNVGQGQGDSISKEVINIDVVDLNWASHPVGHVGVHLAVVDDQGHLIEAEAEAEAEGPEDLSQSHQKPDKAGARSCFGGQWRLESSRE